MKKIQLSMPEPCHQSWNEMTATEQGRFCTSCVKEVIDFSKMSDNDVLNYFTATKTKDTVCGRIFPDQLERNISASPKKKIGWYLNYLAAFLLLAFKSSSVKAQGRIVAKAMHERKLPPVKIPKPVGEIFLQAMIKGTITDENNDPIPFASIKIKESVSGIMADSAGKFDLKLCHPDSLIEVTAVGYEPQQLLVTDLAKKIIQLKRKNELLKEVVATGGLNPVHGRLRASRKTTSKCSVEKSLVTQKRNNTIDSIHTWLGNQSLAIYPNPVLKGSMFFIVVRVKQTGNYSVQITDAAGKLMLQQSLRIAAKQQTEQLQSSSGWSAGVYYLRLFDQNGKFAGITTLLVP